MAAAKPAPDATPMELESKTYAFTVDGTRPILDFWISGGRNAGTAAKDRLTIEVHSPLSGEIFEARTKNGRIEVDNDGRVVYFSRGPGPVGFTLFLGRALVVTMAEDGSKVRIETPSKIVRVERGASRPGTGKPQSHVGSDTLTLELE